MRPNPNRGPRLPPLRLPRQHRQTTRHPLPETRQPPARHLDLRRRPAIVDRQRSTMRRGGFATKSEAGDALAKVLECERTGEHLDDAETVAGYLHGWLKRSPRP
jgi:hypothetical protein